MPTSTKTKGVILIVDDTPTNLQVLFESLKNAGYKVLIAQSGEKALKTAEIATPDIILLDVLMSNLDGFQVCHHLKSNVLTKDIPVIFMTALSETSNKVQGLKLGAVDYITKPIEQDEVLARIDTHLTLQHLRRCLEQQNQQLKQQAKEEKLFTEISERVRQSLNLKSILETAAKEVKQILNCDRVLVTRVANQNISLEVQTIAATIPEIDPKIKAWQTLYSPQEKNQPYQLGHVRIIDDVSSLQSSPEHQLREKLRIQAELIIPIWLNTAEPAKKMAAKAAEPAGESWQIIPNQETLSEVPVESRVNPEKSTANPLFFSLWGYLIIHQCNAPRQWQESEINLLRRLSTQLAIGIQQALLYYNLKKANKQLKQLALCDPLTKVFNRRYFEQQLALEWRRLKRVPSPLSLIMCDVDYFKAYNDTYGHQQGDECLRQVAQAIAMTAKRPGDCVARYGGEEFVIILPHTPMEGAIRVAELINTQIKNLNIHHVNSLVSSVVTVSLGVASTVPNNEDIPAFLVEAADQALYTAKSNGRDGVAVYQDAIGQSKSKQTNELHWNKLIRQALTEDLFCLYAQSITPISSQDRRKHFEILLRLKGENNQIISPHAFLDIANHYSLMPKIDSWVVEHLFNHISQADRQDWDNFCFSVNISGSSLNNQSFLEFLAQKLTDYHLPPELFCFEITESEAIANLTQVSTFIKSLKNLGCSFALDDFGKGMSSLTYLKNLSVDYLKIDGSFIKEINTDSVAKAMVETINNLAQVMGLKTIAEFVETEAILHTLQDLKVDYAQGYYFDKPSPLVPRLRQGAK